MEPRELILAVLVWLAFGHFATTPLVFLSILHQITFGDFAPVSQMADERTSDGYAKALGRHLRHRQVRRWYGNFVWRIYSTPHDLPRQILRAVFWPFSLPVSIVAGNKAVARILWHARGEPRKDGKPYYGPPL